VPGPPWRARHFAYPRKISGGRPAGAAPGRRPRGRDDRDRRHGLRVPGRHRRAGPRPAPHPPG